MTDTSELVKQLLRESRHHTDVKAEAAKAIKRLEREFADFNRLALKHRRELEQQLADENTAKAIERLERERERLEENRTQLIKNCDDWSAKWQAAEQQLADARAEIERKDAALERIAEESAATWVTDVAREALTTPAPSTGEAERPVLTRPQREILHHTKWRAAGRMYCGAKDDADIQALIRFGYMRDCGTPGHLPDNEAYFTITETGLKALADKQQEQEG